MYVVRMYRTYESVQDGEMVVWVHANAFFFFFCILTCNQYGLSNSLNLVGAQDWV